jgi:hypothetical protein
MIKNNFNDERLIKIPVCNNPIRPPGPDPGPGPGPDPVPVLDGGGPGIGDLVPVPVPDPAAQRQSYGTLESTGNTGKVEAFADDTTPMGILDREGIYSIKNILVKFAEISGLRCNIEKSQILVIGTDTVPEYVTSSGFAVVNSIKVLGFNITRNYRDLDDNLENCSTKIKKIVKFWDRFRLSLPGRISVAKTLLLSQITFHATVIPVNDAFLSEMQSILNKFILGKIRLSNEMICRPVKLGGLGFIDLKTFVMSLQCSWIKRALE